MVLECYRKDKKGVGVLSDLLLGDRKGCLDEGDVEGERDKGRRLFSPVFGD